MDITIREFEEQDADELVRVWRTSFEKAVGVLDPHPLEEQRRFLVEQLAPNHTIRVVWAQDRIVGFIAVTPDSISQLYLAEEAQGQGIGRGMMDVLLEFAGPDAAVYLEVRTDNEPAINLYTSLGFVTVGLRKRYYRASGADAYTMRREPA